MIEFQTKMDNDPAFRRKIKARTLSDHATMVNEHDLPVLPRSPREQDGRHWGMKHGFGWSNATNAPEPALLIAALMTGNRQPIQEAVQHYGGNNVMAYWSRMRVYAPPFEYLRMPDKPSLWDYRDKLGTSGIALVDAVLQNVKSGE